MTNIKEDVEMLKALLDENGINTYADYGAYDSDSVLKFLTNGGPVQIFPMDKYDPCNQPNIADPEYIEKLKVFIEICKNHMCHECPNNTRRKEP